MIPGLEILVLEPNRTGFSFASDVAILQCNVAILMCKLLGARWSNFTLVLNVYYKIKGKLVSQACNVCISNIKLILNAISPVSPLESEYVYNYNYKFLRPTCRSILQHCIALLQYCSQKNIRFGSKCCQKLNLILKNAYFLFCN